MQSSEKQGSLYSMM